MSQAIKGKPSNKIELLTLFVGLVLLKLFYYGVKNYSEEVSEPLIIIIIVALILRLLSGFWTISLTNKHRLNQTLWVFLAFIFGSWQLIFLNFAVWFRSNKNKS